MECILVSVQMQGVIQRMLHYDLGVPVRSHTRRLVSTVPSAFIGELADLVQAVLDTAMLFLLPGYTM